ncbi:MAG: N-acetylmuramoyl-L-alanine amidase, partial [Chloroflexales bacterium]|nr:N-acetylmuramoyl-L-alanine amidase [Chloroflexales bacterium]
FQNPATYVSTHYLVRSTDGQVAQLVRAKHVAWHAGNWYFNGHSIGIEHEGVAIEGATWYTESMYRASARLVRYLAARYQIPLDRAHIIGHDEIPGPTPAAQAGMHWDPGPFWDWEHYMELLGSPLRTTADSGQSPIVTIAPRFADNQPQLTYCYRNEATDCRDVPRQPANFVYLRTAPSLDAPLVANDYIGSSPAHANNWANKAVAGQQFYRAARQGDWDAVYFGGQVAWLHNPGYANTAPARALPVTPRAGLATIPVYGRAYPEHAAYPTGVVTQTLVPIYEMPAGQSYVATDLVDSAYYWAPTYAVTPEAAQYTAVRGETQYYQIYFNHRFGFVRASDVTATAHRSLR